MSHYFKKNHGFTLIEFLISITLVSVILTIILLNQSNYTEKAALTNLADEIGLSISQAQVYGIGVKELTTGSSDFSASYGLSFNLLNSGSNSSYIYFVDRDGDGIYDGDWSCPTGESSECLSKTEITRGNYISSLCVSRTSGTDICNLDRVDISFARPSTEAQLVLFSNGGQLYSPANIEGAGMTLMSPSGLMKSVIAYKTGQVSIKNGSFEEEIELPSQSCVGTYNCSQWNNTSRTTCTGDGHMCTWSSWWRRCSGSNRSCGDFSQSLCTPIGCTWQ